MTDVLTYPRLVVGALIALTAGASGQQLGSATFYAIVRNDTIAIERITRTADHLDGEIFDRARGIRERYSLQLARDGSVTRTDLEVFRSASDSVPMARARIQPKGDSMIVDVGGGGTQRLASRAGAITYVNPSAAILEQALARAKRIGGTPVQLPFFHAAGGQTTLATITWLPGDSATIELGAVVFRAALSPDGRLVAATVPSQALRFVRADGTRDVRIEKPDYSAPADAPYTAQEVVVPTPAGFKLAGTLTLPKYRDATGAPAIITITGSGPQDRDEALPGVSGYRPFRQLADTLGRRGIAVLRLDDRGVGGSDAGPTDPTSADFANDIRAGLAWLRSRNDIDSRRLGIVGHSEGGMIAPMIAATDSSLKGIVLLAGTALTGRQILDFQQRYAIEHAPALPAEKRDSARAAARRALDSLTAKSAWIRFFLDYDPLATARRVKVPVLILQGATDQQVTPEQAQMLAAAFREGGDRDVTVHVFPATDHLFLADSSGNPAGYATLPVRQIRPEIIGTIADWLSMHLR